MKRFRINVALLLAGIILSASLAACLFACGLWPQGCLTLIAVAVCTATLIHLQSKLIGTMSAFVKALEMNDTTMRVEAGGDRELQAMSDSMNRISELYHENMRELQTSKLYYDRVLKIMTHEMRNGITPIAAISADMQTHPERYQGKAFAEASGLMHSQAEGIRRFLDAYFNLTHLPEPALVEVRAGNYFHSTLSTCTTKSSVSNTISIVIYCNSIWHKNTLHESRSTIHNNDFILIRIIGYYSKNVSFIVRIKIISINDSYCIV